MYIVLLCVLLGLFALGISWAGLPWVGFISRDSFVLPFHPSSVHTSDGGARFPALAALASQLAAVGLHLAWLFTSVGNPPYPAYFPYLTVSLSVAFALVLSVALLWRGLLPQSFPLGPLSCAGL
eukprot:RCo047427